MTDEVDARIRDAFRAIAAATPDDLQPPEAFWDRARNDADPPARPRRVRWSAVGAAAAAAAVLVVAAAALGHGASTDVPVAAPSTVASPHVQPAIRPTGSARAAESRCTRGPLVHPTRSPQPSGDRLVVSLDLDVIDHDDHVIRDDVQRVSSPALRPLREVGGCVVAYLLLPGQHTPKDARPLPGAPMDARVRTGAGGLTEVYISVAGRTYAITSGNIAADELAQALAAALTRP